MIVLGKRYEFTPFEEEQLKKRYGIEIEYITHISVDELQKALKKKRVKFVVLNLDENPSAESVKYLTFKELEGIKFISIEHFLEQYLGKIYIPKTPQKLDFLETIRPYSPMQYILKRAVDFAISIPLLILASPIMIYSAYRIKKESPDGPVFFKQKRVGLNGEEFECIKFRSMVPDAEKGKPQFASKDDPRVFKWGAFMRKSRIDELPQLFNVFKGEMHLIGPRPERMYWIEKFEKNIPYYNQRHLVKPGITGWAQVNYPYGANEEDAYQKLMYDLYYIKNWSLCLEIKTVFKTIWVMVRKKGV